MSDWLRSGLCLCRCDDTAGGCLHLRSENRQWSSFFSPGHKAADDAEFPILELCKRALKARLQGRRPQFLIMHNDLGSSVVKEAEKCSKKVRVQAVDVCSLDRIGHVDLLLALTMGFDRVLLQQLKASDTSASQAQEVELARAMGGGGRLELYTSAKQLCDILTAAPKTAGRWKTLPPAIHASRQGTARACAAVMLPEKRGPVPLPPDAPYGAVQLDVSACSMCENCVWLCPTDALSVGDRTSELLFVESSCIQCGMCKSICPEDALRLEPRFLSSSSADQKRSLHQAAPVYCTSCGMPFSVSPVMDRLLTRFLGEDQVSLEQGGNQPVQKCSTCRIREVQGDRNKRMASAGLMYLEPRRGR